MFLRVSFCFLVFQISTVKLDNNISTIDDLGSYFDTQATSSILDEFDENKSYFYKNYNQITKDSHQEARSKNDEKQIEIIEKKGSINSNAQLRNYDLVIRSKLNPVPNTKDVIVGQMVPKESIKEFGQTSVTSESLRNNNSYEDTIVPKICDFISKESCVGRGGHPNSEILKKFTRIASLINETVTCCIIPLHNQRRKSRERKISTILPTDDMDSHENIGRVKRSEDIAQKQRNILLKRNYAHPNYKLTENMHKRVDADVDYEDPYWNIKTKEIAKNKKQTSTITTYNLNGNEYYDDYDVGVPSPSISSFVSDHGKKLYRWTISYTNRDITDDDYNADEGYINPSINPRLGNEKRKKSNSYVPGKINRTTPELLEDDLIQPAVNFQSYPATSSAMQNFHVLNFLKKPRMKFVPKLSPTLETIPDYETGDGDQIDGNQEASSEDFEEQQIFKGCGKALKSIPVAMKNTERQIGSTENGSHPWMGLLVPTRKLNNLLCYASLIHPRAALSAADCVHRTSPREVTLIVGLWNLNERSRLKSRIVTVYLHPKYNGGLSNNLALLHWKRPLKLGVNVHPVCLSDPRLGAECFFVGWGGFDQGIHSRSRWQQAKVHPCSDHLSINGLEVPSGAFCASVSASNIVTGFGGSLVCNILGRLSAVGVAISRDSPLVLLAAHDWIIESIGVLQEP